LGKVLNATNKNEQTPLFLAIHKGFAGLVEKMIHRKELKAEQRDKEKRTPLYIAIEVDQLEAFKRILKTVPRGLGAPRNRRRLLCHSAEKSQGVEVFEWLLTQTKATDAEETETTDENKKKFNQKLKLHNKSQETKEQLTFKKLLESPDDSPLHSIALSRSNHSCEKYELLVKHLGEEEKTLVNAYLNHQNTEKQTPLHIAAEHPNIHNPIGNNESAKQLKKDKLDLIAKMLRSEADPNLLNKNGENFLNIIKRLPDEWFEIVMKKKETELRKILIDKGDDASLSLMFEKFQSLAKNQKDPSKDETGEFVKKNYVKRQQEYEKSILFQSKDGN
jgi:ankyrin repeat protein